MDATSFKRDNFWGWHSYEIVRPRRTSVSKLPDKSRAYCCCLQLWLPIACVTLIFACVTNTCITDMLCLLALRHCLINLKRIAVACNSGFPLPVWLLSLPVWPTHALRCSRSFKTLVVRACIAVLGVSPLKSPTRSNSIQTRCIPSDSFTSDSSQI